MPERGAPAAWCGGFAVARRVSPAHTDPAAEPGGQGHASQVPKDVASLRATRYFTSSHYVLEPLFRKFQFCERTATRGQFISSELVSQ